jgi:hypothetical protein
MSAHGTHVASMILGQSDGPIRGIAPGCHGFVAPIFADNGQGPASQLDLARAINQAVEAGAHVINISGGELSNIGAADPMLMNAVRFCNDEGALIVAAAGNDSCRCLHVPAALPSVLAVGAMDEQGLPLDSSNWGDVYQSQGILAPGRNMLGAVPGDRTALKSGTSFAAPVVSGVVALLLSLQMARGVKPTAHDIREAILASAIPCDQTLVADCQRFLVGRLNIPGAYTLISRGRRIAMSVESIAGEKVAASDANRLSSAMADGVTAQEQCANTQGGGLQASEPAYVSSQASLRPLEAARAQGAASTSPRSAPSAPANGIEFAPNARNGEATLGVRSSSVTPACACASQAQPSKQLVFALGTLGYDFGTEARRDGFKSLMPSVFGPYAIPYIRYPGGPPPEQAYPGNPYDPRQIVNYLAGFPPPRPPFPTEGGFPLPTDPKIKRDVFPPPLCNPPEGYPGSPANMWDAAELIWTLNIELTPIYALRPRGTFATEVYQRLVEFLAGQVRLSKLPSGEPDPDFVSRVSIPGILTGETVQLFSGQVVPVIEPQVRGMFAWNENALIGLVIQRMQSDLEEDLQEIDDNLKKLKDKYEAEKDPTKKAMLKAELDRKTTEAPQKKSDLIANEPTAEQNAEDSLRQFLDRIYYDLRNLGQTPPERALNYAATNAFQAIAIFGDPAAEGFELDRILVERSGFCRKDSDCWDVKLRFFDPENVLRARLVDRFTVDVSDTYPVLVGPVRKWSEPG